MSVGSTVNEVLGGNNDYGVANPYDPNALNSALTNNNQVFGQQQSLAKALLARSQGQGPNPALDQLKQTTQQNIQGAAGMAASARGLDPAYAAKIATEAGANANQNANAEAATLGAQQEVSAEGELQNLYGTMGSQQLQQQGVINSADLGAAGINANVAQNNANNAQKTGSGVLNGAASAAASFLAKGGRIPGKAVVKGDSLKNDNVNVKASPGEIVIPRSHATPEGAKNFVQALIAHEKGKGNPKDKVKVGFAKGGAVVNAKSAYGAILSAHHDLHKRMKALESKRSA